MILLSLGETSGSLKEQNLTWAFPDVICISIR